MLSETKERTREWRTSDKGEETNYPVIHFDSVLYKSELACLEKKLFFNYLVLGYPWSLSIQIPLVARRTCKTPEKWDGNGRFTSVENNNDTILKPLIKTPLLSDPVFWFPFLFSIRHS